MPWYIYLAYSAKKYKSNNMHIVQCACLSISTYLLEQYAYQYVYQHTLYKCLYQSTSIWQIVQRNICQIIYTLCTCISVNLKILSFKAIYDHTCTCSTYIQCAYVSCQSHDTCSRLQVFGHCIYSVYHIHMPLLFISKILAHIHAHKTVSKQYVRDTDPQHAQEDPCYAL